MNPYRTEREMNDSGMVCGIAIALLLIVIIALMFIPIDVWTAAGTGVQP